MDDGTWRDVASMDDFAASDAIAVPRPDGSGREIAIYLVDDELFATDNACSHGDARLCDGFLEGHEIECPFHQGRFDVRTGQATCAPAEVAIAVVPVRRQGERIEVRIG